MAESSLDFVPSCGFGEVATKGQGLGEWWRYSLSWKWWSHGYTHLWELTEVHTEHEKLLLVCTFTFTEWVWNHHTSANHFVTCLSSMTSGCAVVMKPWEVPKSSWCPYLGYLKIPRDSEKTLTFFWLLCTRNPFPRSDNTREIHLSGKDVTGLSSYERRGWLIARVNGAGNLNQEHAWPPRGRSCSHNWGVGPGELQGWDGVRHQPSPFQLLPHVFQISA
jgi:hypothetical protein